MSVDVESDRAARIEALKRWTLDWYDRGVNRFDTSLVDDVIDDGATCDAASVWPMRGKQDVRDSLARVNRAFSERNFGIEYISVDLDCNDGAFDRVSVWYTFTGRFTGDLVLEGDRGTVPPTNEPIEIHGVSRLDLKDGHIVGGHAVTDLFGVLGHIPRAPAAAA